MQPSATSITQKFSRGSLLIAVLALSSGFAQVAAAAVVQQQWVAHYNGPSSYWDEVTDMAVGDGCVCVTGFAYTDLVTRAFATVKYDLSGRQLWARTYGLGGVNGSAQANAVAVDSAGNVVVSGWSYEYVPGPPEAIICDAATLKYDSDGNLLWQHRFRLPGMNNQPQDVVIDNAGNVYVAGAAWVGGGFDLMLLKYSPDGELLWDTTLGRSGDRWDAGYSVALDSNSNPVVAGYTEPFLDPLHITFGYLVKVSSSGNLLWQRDHESYTNASTWWEVAISPTGLIYTSGELAPPGDLSHVWTSQYDSAGTLIWDRHYEGNASGSNYSGGMACTPDGGVVVCGTSDDIDAQGGVQSIITIRYESDGTQAWARLERAGYAQALGTDVAVDDAGNAYVTGYGFDKNGFEDVITVSYKPEGDMAWTQIYADPHGRSDRATDIAVDASSSIFVASNAWIGFENYYDFTTLRYTIAKCSADIDVSGSVDIDDLVGVLTSWGPCPNPPVPCPADIVPRSGNGLVDIDDLVEIITQWGACP